MNSKLVWAGGLAVLLVVAYMTRAGDDPGEAARQQDQETEPEVPVYASTIRSPSEVDVRTDATGPDDLRLIFEDVRDQRTEGNWWEVTISCASIDESADVDTVLATGRFANTQRGVDAGGLDDIDDVEFETTERDECTPVAPETPGAVTVDDVVAALEDADLAVTDRRDGSSICAELHCVSRMVSDQLTVIVWPDAAGAERWAGQIHMDVVRLGPVTTVQYNPNGFDRDGAGRAAFEDAIAEAYPSSAGPTDADGDGRPSS